MCHLFEESARAAIFVFWLDEKHKLGSRHWDLASCQVSFNSNQQFQRRSWKCLSQSEARAAMLFFRSARKTQNLVEDVEILLSIKFRWIPFSDFRGEVENVSANQRPGRPSCFSDRPEKHKLGRGRWVLASCQVSLNSVQQFQRSWKCLSLSEARAAIFFFDQPKKHKLGRGHLRSCFLTSFFEFRSAVSEEKSKMCQPIRGQGDHLVFLIGPKNTKLGRGRWDLAFCQVSLNSVQRFQRRSWKCEKLTENGRTDNAWSQ